jgi:hypothetical protein
LKTFLFTGLLGVTIPGKSCAKTTRITEAEEMDPLVKAEIFSVKAGLTAC